MFIYSILLFFIRPQREFVQPVEQFGESVLMVPTINNGTVHLLKPIDWRMLILLFRMSLPLFGRVAYDLSLFRTGRL